MQVYTGEWRQSWARCVCSEKAWRGALPGRLKIVLCWCDLVPGLACLPAAPADSEKDPSVSLLFSPSLLSPLKSVPAQLVPAVQSILLARGGFIPLLPAMTCNICLAARRVPLCRVTLRFGFLVWWFRLWGFCVFLQLFPLVLLSRPLAYKFDIHNFLSPVQRNFLSLSGSQNTT